MPDVLPFRALRYTPAAGSPERLIAPRSDLRPREDYVRLAGRSRHNIVNLELPDPGRPAPGSYRRAARRLRAWRDAGVLALDPEAAYYLHEQVFQHRGKPRRRRALFARVRLSRDTGDVRPHERTLEATLDDRLRLLRELRAHLSPILCMFRPAGPLPEPDREPILDVALDGDRHRLWRLASPGAVARVGGCVQGPLYIADGHHRWETALRYREERARARGRFSGEEPENFAFLALVPYGDLIVLPWHRLLDPPSVPADIVDRLRRHFRVEAAPGPGPDTLLERLAELDPAGPAFGLLGPGEGDAHLLRPTDLGALQALLPADRSEAWRSLDVALLAAVLHDCFALDEATVRAGALRYVLSADEALGELQARRAGLAFLLRPTPAGQVLAVADAGETMPPKSTCFFPKLPAGLMLLSLMG